MQKIKDKIKVIAFDADDTLWDNESFYKGIEHRFCSMLSEFGDGEHISAELFKTEMGNMDILGYGAKAFTISLIETAIRVSGGQISAETIEEITGLGKSLLRIPAAPLPGVTETLEKLYGSGRYRLVVITKGDLLDQENKLRRSSLEKFFSHVEVVSEKTCREYREICNFLDIRPEELLMVGNSFKSDIKPVLELGGYGVHIPFKVMWQHEETEEFDHPHLYRTSDIRDVLGIL